MIQKILTLLIFPIIVVGGCGVKGPPIPPDVLVPKAISDLQGKIREAKLYLSWGLPRKNVDGSEPADLVAFRVLRREERGGCLECPGEFTVRAELDLRTTTPGGYRLERGILTWMDKDLREETFYIYKVLGINHWGYPSSPSNEFIIQWGPPPPPPSSLRGEGRDGSILLIWEPVAEADGYHIYRREEANPFPSDPLNETPVRGNNYADKELQKDRTYFYVVRGVRFFGETPVEGKGSGEIAVSPH